MRCIYVLVLFLGGELFAQNLAGVISDKVTGETIPMANIIVKLENEIVGGGASGFDGEYTIGNLKPNTYSVEVSYIGYATRYYTEVRIEQNKTTLLDVSLSEDNGILCSVEISSPLPKGNKRFRKKGKKAKSKARNKSVNSKGNQSTKLSVRGGRSDKTVYFVDGVKVLGKPEMSNSRINKVRISTGGVPAEYENSGRNTNIRKHRESPILWFSEKKSKAEIIIDESYEEIVENEFLNSFQNPVTTFSIDVDQASYSNMRRFINTGLEPPKHSVRIEEMINYFDYDYPKPEEGIMESYTELSICPWNTNHQLLQIGVQSKAFNKVSLKGNNLVFLIDVSGSMSVQNKLPLVKKTLTMLTKQLKSNDKISIVVYSGAAGCVLKPTAGDRTSEILEALNALESGGSTAGGAGIELAYAIAQENFIKNGNNRIVLATDGDFNVGTTSNESLEAMIAEKRSANIFLTVLGYGMGDYKDDKLELLANKGNGNYAYIDNLQEAERFLVKGFNSSMYTLAKDVKLQIEFNPKYVQEYRLIGYENRALENSDFEDDNKDAGELGTDQSVTALYELIPTQTQSQSSALKYRTSVDSPELLNLKIRYKAPNDTESIEVEKAFTRELIDLEHTSERFRFSASVAMFGLILRDSKYKGKANCKNVIQMAKHSKSTDEYGYKGEFIRLVRTYKNSVLPMYGNLK